MATIGDLRGQLLAWTVETGVTVPLTVQDECINSALREMMDSHPFRGQETSTAPLAYAANLESLALPADFISEKGVYQRISTGNPASSRLAPLDKWSRDRWIQHLATVQIQEATDDDLGYYLYGGNIFLVPTPTTAVTIVIDYFAYLAELADANPTNFFTVRYPQVLRHGALKHLWQYLHEEERMAFATAAFDGALQKAILNDKTLSASDGTHRR